MGVNSQQAIAFHGQLYACVQIFPGQMDGPSVAQEGCSLGLLECHCGLLRNP